MAVTGPKQQKLELDAAAKRLNRGRADIIRQADRVRPR